jgi:opacity protein-like surface antigen
MKKILFLAMFTFASFSLVAAQSDDYHQNEFFAGYSLNRFTDDGGPTAHGFNAAYVYNFNRYIGVKADFSAHFKRDSNTFLGTTFTSRSDVYRYMGGVQIKDNNKDKKVKPFAHALIGGGSLRFSSSSGSFNSSSTRTNFALAVGGGLDIKATDRISVRVAQVDYAPIFNTGGIINAVRFSAGIVFH